MVRKKDTPKGAGVAQQSKANSPLSNGASQNQSIPGLTKRKHASIQDQEDSSGRPTKVSRTLPAQDAVKDSLPSKTALDLSKKRPSPSDGDDELVRIVGKRPKINSNAGLAHRSVEPEEVSPQKSTVNTATVEMITEGSATAAQASATVSMTAALPSTIPAEVQHLRSKYDFTTMSILSSAKIEVKVRNVLFRVGKFSFADIEAKPGIVILHAYANCANKMVSIVEIAKGEIQKEKGKWYQYSKLEGELKPLKMTQSKKDREGKTIAEWATEQDRTDDKAKTNESAEMGEEDMDTGVLAQKDMHGYQDEDDAEVAFETMKPPKKHASVFSEVKEKNKVRAVPILTIYLARVPVPGLKELYG
ncbi:hypothetical protein P7C71_g2188, partial [Lecanoromycetidae sp. Uapishka_2]